VVCGVTIVKQKRQASAAFLGVLPISTNVVRVCCILTTILRGFAPPHGIGSRKSSSGDRPAEAFLANQLLRENTASVTFESPHELKDGGHEKGRSGGRCGLSETLLRQATV
jgi:hypothetical protein